MSTTFPALARTTFTLLAWVLSHSWAVVAAADSAKSSQQNCIHRPCVTDRSCPPSLLEKIPLLCGPTDNQHCFSRHPPECRASLVRLKSAPELQTSCYCQNPSSRSCQDYQNLLYNHPCLRNPAGHFPQSARPYEFDLEFAGQLVMSKHILLSCTSALHACRKSPLCRRVYDEFRRRCKVKDNRCRMTNAALCYNSYELIKLTPLWRCICDDLKEKRCLRIQRSVVGNPCIGGMPHLYDVGDSDDSDDLLNGTHFGDGGGPAGTSGRTPTRPPPVIAPPRRTTPPIRIWPARTTTTMPPRPRPRPTTAAAITAGEPEEPAGSTEDEPTAAPLEYDTTGESQEPPLPEAAEIVDIFPGPDEEFDLVPHIAAALMYPIAVQIKAVLVEHFGMATEPPPPVTTTPIPSDEVGEEIPPETGESPLPASEDDGDLTETTRTDAVSAAVGLGQQAKQTTRSPQRPLVAGSPKTSEAPSGTVATTTTIPSGGTTRESRRRTMATMSTRVTGSTVTSAASSTRIPTSVRPSLAGGSSLPRLTEDQRRRTTAATTTTKSGAEYEYDIETTSATLTDEAGVTSADTEDYNTDYPTGGLTGEFSATTEAAETEETTTVIIDYSVQDPKMLPSGTCWQEINRWRENPTFDDAMNRFHEKCRWATPANESCDATACLDAEARVHRWMGDMLPHCRNLSCEDSHPQCAQLQQLLVPGCIEAAFFLEEDEGEPVTCRDLKRNGLVLSVPRGSYKRIFNPKNEYCSELCTCDNDGKVKCETLPCVESKECQGSYAVYPAGAPGFKAFQGQCLCYMSKMLCIRPYNYTITKGVWLFMAYSSEEEELLLPRTNLTIDNDLIPRMRRLPYPLKREEPCLFHREPSESDYVILRSDEFEFDNTTAEQGSDGTKTNEEYCDKFFQWIANEVTDKKSARQDPLLSLIKLAEVEWDKRIASSAIRSALYSTASSSLVAILISSTVLVNFHFSAS